MSNIRKSKSESRVTRKSTRRSNHEPLLNLVKEEGFKVRVKPSTITLKPLTKTQANYDSSIFVNSITFGIGPAGTGKTWWAAARAAEALKNGDIEKIIITRPAVEAGESLGFLPGELDEKYEPYFRPVKDALEEYLGSGALEFMIKSGKIEARPLAFLRGATVKNAWLIADEMQNATVTQMKLLLTRIGENAKFIINGDPAQCDLPNHVKSGLLDATNRLKSLKGVSVIRFEKSDIVRSGLCQDIVEAYEVSTSEPIDNDYKEDMSGVLKTLKVDND
jgi:phosphate starvation-inducible PhoH-like protein